MATETDRLWKLAGELSEARKRNAAAQGNALKRQKQAQEKANRDNWFGPTVQGALGGAMTGFMAGGPMGALAGGVGGAGLGYLGREQFNENPTLMPAIASTAGNMALLHQMRQPVTDPMNPDFSQVPGLSNAAVPGGGMNPTMDFGSDGATPQAGTPGFDFGHDMRLGFPLETSSFDTLNSAAQDFQNMDLGGQHLQAPGGLSYQSRQGPAQLSATPGVLGEQDIDAPRKKARKR